MKRILNIMMALGCALLLCACSVDEFEYDAGHSQADEGDASYDPASGTVSEMEITLTFDFGERIGTYTGEMADGLPDGQGSFSSSNTEGVAWVYEGGWKQGHLYGEGTTTFETGYTEAGWYENDSLNGQGSIYQNGRLTYEGAFADNIPNGAGTLYSYSGEAIYSGSFAEGYIDETKEARAGRVEGFRQQCASLDYSALYESVQNEDGAYVKVTGTVAYVLSGGGFEYDTSFVIFGQNMYTEDYTNLIYVNYRLSVDEEPVLEGQTVIVWAQAGNLYTDEAEDGTAVSMPYIEAWDVMDISGTAL